MQSHAPLANFGGRHAAQRVIQNKTWDLVDLPPVKRAIPLKWVFKINYDAKGNFKKYKPESSSKAHYLREYN